MAEEREKTARPGAKPAVDKPKAQEVEDLDIVDEEEELEEAPEPRQRQERPRRRFTSRRKVCLFCAEHMDYIDYKNVDLLYRFISDRAKILSRRKTGTCAKHQRRLAVAIKRARHLALLPFTDEHMRS